jgi:hypothetical protein
VRARVAPSRRGVTSNNQTPPLLEEEAPLLNTYMSRRKQTSWSWIKTGLETKHYCVGEGQHQFNRPTVFALILVVYSTALSVCLTLQRRIVR